MRVVRLEKVDHTQVVGYAGADPTEMAVNGITHVGTLSKYRFSGPGESPYSVRFV